MAQAGLYILVINYIYIIWEGVFNLVDYYFVLFSLLALFISFFLKDSFKRTGIFLGLASLLLNAFQLFMILPDHALTYILVSFSSLIFIGYYKVWPHYLYSFFIVVIYSGFWFLNVDIINPFGANSLELVFKLLFLISVILFAGWLAQLFGKIIKTYDLYTGTTDSDHDSNYLDYYEIPYLMYTQSIADTMLKLAFFIENASSNNLVRLGQQKSKLDEIIKMVLKLNVSYQESKGILSDIKGIDDETLQSANSLEEEVHSSLLMVKEMVDLIHETETNVDLLIDLTKKMESVVKLIDKITNQTRLLALNASIEASRFPDKRVGFEMVADEVKSLVVLTQESVLEISSTIRDIKIKTRSIREIIKIEAVESIKGLEIATLGEQSVQYLASLLKSTKTELNYIMGEIEENEDLVLGIRDFFDKISGFVSENEERMHTLKKYSEDIQLEANNMKHIVKVSGLSDFIEKQNDQINSLINSFVTEFKAILERAITLKYISHDDLFDRNYQPIDDKSGRYNCRYDKFFDAYFQEVLDKYLDLNDNLVYFYLMDDKGYVATHNSVYTQTLTGDWEKDQKIHRAKRIYDDHTTRNTLRSKETYLFQCRLHYSMSEPIMDVSVPLFLKEQKWGYVKAGFIYR